MVRLAARQRQPHGSPIPPPKQASRHQHPSLLLTSSAPLVLPCAVAAPPVPAAPPWSVRANTAGSATLMEVGPVIDTLSLRVVLPCTRAKGGVVLGWVWGEVGAGGKGAC